LSNLVSVDSNNVRQPASDRDPRQDHCIDEKLMANEAPDQSTENRRQQDPTNRTLEEQPIDPPWILRAGLVLAACALTWFFWEGAQPSAISALGQLGGGPNIPWLNPGATVGNRLTQEERFLFEGDTSRKEQHEQQRAIWEAQPTNRVYLGNYITWLATGPGQNTNELDYCREELATAREVDPDNARLDYLEAAWLFRAAAEVASEQVGVDEEGNKLTEYSLVIHDRAALDEAMAVLLQARAKPELRRYSADMLTEQFDVLGAPRRMVDLLQRITVAASVLLPDLTEYRMLSRASRLYAGLLIEEGNPDQGQPFLDMWHPLTVHLAKDSFTLIDVLVVGALAADAEKSVPPIYRTIGREQEADRMTALASSLARPVLEWRQQREAANEGDDPQYREGERLLRERGGILVMMLLPALGIWPDADDYTADRMLEYTAATLTLLTALCLGLLVAMAFCVAVSLRWRIGPPSPAARPLLIIPDLRTLTKILALGMLLPLGVFLLITRLLPMSGHAFSVTMGAHKLIAEGTLLLATLIVLPIAMTAAHIRRRCQTLGVATQTWHARSLLWPLGLGAASLVLIWLCPATSHAGVQVFAGMAAAVIGISLGIGVILCLAQGLAGRQASGQFYGTSFRTLIPVLALVIIVLGLTARPFLVSAQARYLAGDTLLVDKDRPGFTRLENDLVERLRGEILTEVDLQQP
jgi:hypothetical protein